jgi:hypothetical protein
VIVAQADLDAILDRKVRKRLLELPVRYGKFGELKRCPMRVGGVYNLSAPIPFDRFLERAPGQPAPATRRHEPDNCPACKGAGKIDDVLLGELGLEVQCPDCFGVGKTGVLHYGGSARARSVLWLIDRCNRHYSKPVTITVRDVERQGETWLVSFLKGDEAEVFNDAPVYLASTGDFTTVASRQAVPGDPEYLPPFAEDLARARQKALEKRVEPHRTDLAAMRAAHKRMAERKHTMAVAARRRLALIERETEKLAGELAIDSGATLSESDRAESQPPAEVEGERPPSGIGSDVRPSPAQLGE